MKKKADCTPKEWADYLLRQREANKKSYSTHPERKMKIAARNRVRYANDPAYRERVLAKRARYERLPAAIEKKKCDDLDRARERRMGLTREMVDLLFEMQKGCCAVCDRPFGEKTPFADHCHDTKQPRGLLCPICNTVEGHLKRRGLSPTAFAQRLEAYLANPPAAIVVLA